MTGTTIGGTAAAVPNLTDQDLAKRFGRRKQTIGLWRRRGVMSAGGKLVRLRAQKVGGTYFTSEVWVQEWLDELNKTAA